MTELGSKTVGQWLTASVDLLAQSPSARLDIEVLLGYVLNKNKTWLYAYSDEKLTSIQSNDLHALIKRRNKGEPIAYLVGQQEFWSLNLKVSPDTLIPRSDTETLVEAVLTINQQLPGSSKRLLDLGTGTGAIALALASEKPDWNITATDIKENAVVLACENKKILNIDNVDCIQSNWFENVSGVFDFIVSNPPYIDLEDKHLLQGDVRFEPHSALVAEQKGLADLHLIVTRSKEHLAPSGWLVLEHGYQQGEAVKKMLHENGYQLVQEFSDLQGYHRVSAGQIGREHADE